VLGAEFGAARSFERFHFIIMMKSHSEFNNMTKFLSHWAVKKMRAYSEPEHGRLVSNAS
jgi:hypothetical protein